MLLRTLVVLTLALLWAPETLAHEKRTALVIGNSAYRHTGRLDNPTNDATDIAAVLRTVGFKVIERRDLGKAAMDQAIQEFAESLSGADVALFFYAGHGLQVAGQNYLVPVDAKLATAAALDFEMVRIDVVHRSMEREAKTNILFIDACRDNPLARNLARSLGTRSSIIGRGLAAVESGEGTLISFSTQPGNVALDGTGRNSPFAAALVKQIPSEGEDLSAILIKVRRQVMQETSRRQVPWEHSALTARFFFKEAVLPPPPKTAAPDEIGRISEQLKRLEDLIARQKASQPPVTKEASAELPGAVSKAPRPLMTGPAPGKEQIEAWRNTAQPATFKVQSIAGAHCCWSDIFAAKLASLSGGKLRIEVVASGSIVPSSGQLDAVSSGKIIMGWSSPSYWFQMSAALHVYGGQVPLGHDQVTFIRWVRDRGEAELNQIYVDVVKLKVRVLACGSEGPEGIWFKRPVASGSELKGVRVRTGGFPLMIMEKLAMRPQFLITSEIVPALEKGTVEAAEFSQPWVDDELGIPRVARNLYYPSWHAPTTLWQLEVNRDTWNGLSEAQRQLIAEACRLTIDHTIAAHQPKAYAALEKLKSTGVEVRALSKEILDTVRIARDEVARELSARDAAFKRAWDSYMSFQ